MTLPRKKLVAVEDTPYYHVVSRCVRRSYLCGVDAHSGKNYDLFLLLQNRHTPGRRTVPSLSITTAGGGLRTVFVFYRHSLPSIFVAMR
ncbi:MAG: hypothetical protein ACI845_004197 [Gammaproteobacteria bacterium]|jgi:hypothetical protein